MMHESLRAMLTVLALASVGCGAHVNETHYFRSTHVGADGMPNYYRVEVTARSTATKIRYLAGYFSDEAVNQYFNEFTQPETLSGTLLPDEDDSEDCAQTKTEARELTPVDAKLEDRSLVLVLSSNVDEIAAQLGALAKNRQTQAALTAIINREQIQAADEAKARDASDASAAKSVAEAAERSAARLGADGLSLEDTEAELLLLANTLAEYLGASERFTEVAEASAWLEANRARIQLEIGR